MPKQTFADLALIYQQNIYPEMLSQFAEQIGVSFESLDNLGIGFYPLRQAWVFPERDDKGNVIGLLYRFHDGKKQTEKGSKRGLTYAVNSDYNKEYEYVSGKHNWKRVSKQIPCHVCGKFDGCLVSADNPTNPTAVVCVRIPEGSTKALKLGYLHILDPKRNKLSGPKTTLPKSDFPIIITEGQTDTATAMDLGFVAIGRPSAESGIDLLPSLVRGRDVVIVGDNDAGAGQRGMESVYQTLEPICKSVTKALPPETVKDLREWKQKFSLTQGSFLDYVESQGQKTSSNSLLPSDVAYDIAKFYLEGHKAINNVLTLRNYRGQWVQYVDGRYVNYSTETLRGELYNFINEKYFPKIDGRGAIVVSQFKPTRSKISDIVDAMNAFCPIDKDPPLWLTDDVKPNPRDLIAFKNGILDVNEYINNDKITLYPLTPELFTFNILPYDFDPETESELFTNFCNDVFSGDKNKILLLSQWLGYNLVPDMSMEKFMLFIGPPRSGKSTTLEVLSAMLGHNQCGSTNFQSLCGQFGYQPLVGKLAAIIGDTASSQNRDINAALEKILQITGGDPVTVNRKGVKQLPFIYLMCRFTIATNNLPTFIDHAKALEPRTNILHFENSYIGKEDRTLKQRLQKEAEAGKIVNFALRGLKILRQQKEFAIPKSSAKIQKSFVELTTPVTTFLSDCCIVGRILEDSDFVTKNQLYEVWQKWCTEQGQRPGTNQLFGRWLLGAYPTVKTDRISLQGRRQYIYRRIKLKDWVFKELLGDL